MSIPHLQDLPTYQFLDAVEHLNEYHITEKVDGTALIVGIDNDGNFYTSREGKSGQRCYRATDYPECPASESFMNAHIYLSHMFTFFQSVDHYQHGSAWQVEVLYGRQPNAIVYGSNRVVFLQPLIGDSGKMSAFPRTLPIMESSGITIHGFRWRSEDGKTVKVEEHRQRWSSTIVPAVKPSTFLDINIQMNIDYLTLWLSEGFEIEGTHYTNQELLAVNLNKIPKDKRELVKESREINRVEEYEIKGRIVRLLIAPLRKMTSGLVDTKLFPNEDIGIEGVVFKHTEMDHIFKIVNKDEFTNINCFNHLVRNHIRRSSYGKLSEYAPAYGDVGQLRFMDGSIYDDFLTALSNSLWDINGLHSGMQVKRTLRKYAGEDADHTCSGIVAEWNDHIHITGAREIVSLCCGEHIVALENMLEWYMNKCAGFGLDLGNGKWIGYSRAIHQRNLLMFAEMTTELHRIQESVRFATSREDIVGIVFEKQLSSIH